MPQVFKVGSYWVYFWTNEGDPLEPIHVHISEGSPSPNATKVWITKSGKCLLCSRTSKIPDVVLRNIIIVVSKSAPSILCYTPTLKTTLKKLFSGI